MTFPSHDLDTAPEASKPLMEAAKASFGMVPNLHKVLADSPQAYEAYQRLHKLFSETEFDASELTVVWLAINVEHSCHYCVPAHTAIAQMMKVPDDITTALRNETPLPNEKLEALRTLTVQLVRQRGNLTEAQLDAFFAAGYSHRAVLDVILGIAQKTMSNYTNHVAHTAVEDAFSPLKWERSSQPLDV